MNTRTSTEVDRQLGETGAKGGRHIGGHSAEHNTPGKGPSYNSKKKKTVSPHHQRKQ